MASNSAENISIVPISNDEFLQNLHRYELLLIEPKFKDHISN